MLTALRLVHLDRGRRGHKTGLNPGIWERTRRDADLFVRDLASRVSSQRVQITTDGLGSYDEPIRRYFQHRADHGSEVKDYGRLDDESPERKYSPLLVKQVIRTPLYGVPDPGYISTAYVERQNLIMLRSVLPSETQYSFCHCPFG